MQPKVVVLSVSSKWQDTELIREALRKLHNSNPNVVIRLTKPLQQSAKEAANFIEAMGFRFVESFPLDAAWFKFNSEIRNGEMLYGILRNPRNPQIVVEQRPRADLLIAFWTGGTDNTDDLIKRALGSALPVVVYREKWLKKKGTKEKTLQHVERAATNPKKRTKLTDWRKLA